MRIDFFLKTIIKISNKFKVNFVKPSFKNKALGTLEKEYINLFLPDNPIIVEAGAHIGLDTIELSKMWPNGKIYAFEPVPSIYRQLLQNTKDIKNIKCSSLALSDHSGQMNIYVSSGSSDASSSLLRPKDHLIEHPDVVFHEEITIQTITLDLWASENNINNIDFLWLDLQGYEPLMLKASPKILETVKAIYTEVNLKELYEGAILYPEFVKWLKGKGFSVQKEAIPWQDAGNVLFIKH